MAGTRAHCSAERAPSADSGRPLVELSRKSKNNWIWFLSAEFNVYIKYLQERTSPSFGEQTRVRLEPGLDHRRPGQLILWATPRTLLSSWVEKLRLKGSKSFQKVEKVLLLRPRAGDLPSDLWAQQVPLVRFK